MDRIQIPMPPEVVRQILHRHALESNHPSLEPRIVGFDVVDMEGSARLVPWVGWYDPQGDLVLPGERAIGTGTVRK